ncbi:MAG: hypothetical protein VB119_02870 [Candidatus Metalachnospira sp.]|nr:hypothetical protein [Candidatus Metalachnospira sp.]
MKRAATIFISAFITLSLGVTAFAQGYDISTDDITINQDGSYEITGTSSEHKIFVVGANAVITLENVDITTNNKSAIDIDDNSDVQLIISGTNNLTVTGYGTTAGIHVSGGSLTISGTDSDDDILTVLNTGSEGAAIGSSYDENFTGTITVDSGVTVNAGSENGGAEGAGIGSGYASDMIGEITINDGSVVNAFSQQDGAGIGSGQYGSMSGTITINGGEVNAQSIEYGAGIGAGDYGGVSGTITINDGNVYAYSDYGGAGIGSGDYGDMSGIITINGGNITAIANDDGAGIGCGDYNMTGEIIINGGNVTAVSNGCEVGVGAGYDGYVNGDITIHGDAVITLGDDDVIGSMYESAGTIYLYKGAEINGITVTDIDDLKEAGILNDNMKVELLEEEESGTSYSLDKLNTVSKIKAAKAGDTVYVYESELSKGKLPYYVLEALAKTDNVTLIVVSDSGETAEIKSSSVPEKGKNAFFTVDELLDMTK